MNTATPTEEVEQPVLLSPELQAAVDWTKPKKSPGSDGVYAELLQAGDAITRQLYAICNIAREQGKLPDEWTKLVVVTLPKKGDLGIQGRIQGEEWY